MKFIFLMGGICGFLAAGIASYTAGRSPDRILTDSALGCLVGAALFRWLWSVFLRGFRETYIARQQQAAAVASAATAAEAKKQKA